MKIIPCQKILNVQLDQCKKPAEQFFSSWSPTSYIDENFNFISGNSYLALCDECHKLVGKGGYTDVISRSEYIINNSKLKILK